MEENICELNNRSKEVRHEDYVTDEERIYMTVPFNKGKCSFDYLYQLLYWSFVSLIVSSGEGSVAKWFGRWI